MTADAWFSLVIASLPVAGVVIAGGIYWIPRWRRNRWKRRLDEMFKADEEWWEDQLRGLGNEQPPKPPA